MRFGLWSAAVLVLCAFTLLKYKYRYSATDTLARERTAPPHTAPLTSHDTQAQLVDSITQEWAPPQHEAVVLVDPDADHAESPGREPTPHEDSFLATSDAASERAPSRGVAAPDASRTTDSDGDHRPFNGTTVTALSYGADMFENVCVGHQKKGPDPGGPNRIFSYSPTGDPIAPPWCETSGPIVPWARWFTCPEGRNLSSWYNHSSHGAKLVAEDTVLVMALWNNPAHCLSDEAFSLALDVLSRRVHGTKDDGIDHPPRVGPPSPPFYPRFLFAAWRDYYEDCPASHWCCNFLRSAGFIAQNGSAFRRTELPTVDAPVCFKRLIVPRVAAHRLPLDWSDDNSAVSLARDDGDFVLGKVHQKWPGMYPIEALRAMQERVFDSIRLRSDRWREDELPADVPILLYGRRGRDQRRMTNSAAVKRLLEAKFHAKVRLLGAKWDGYNFTKQAALYNMYPLIVSVHGASMANLFFARPGTKVVEVSCRSGEPAPNLTLGSKEEARTPVEWHGQSGWFSSFSRRLSVEHFVIGENIDCSSGENCVDNEDYGSPISFSANATRLVSFIASRFGLRTREV